MKTARSERERLWIMPFLGQLTDDCRDFIDDLRSSSVTPFTYYVAAKKRKDHKINQLLNPFYVFLNTCSDIYLSSGRDSQTGAFLGRRIVRALRSIEISQHETGFREFLNVFCADNPHLYDYCSNKLQKQFSVVTDPEKHFFRLMNTSSTKFSRTNRKLETFVFENVASIENALSINSFDSSALIIAEEEVLISAMNYSVKAGGKRLRMLLLLMIADLYGIDSAKILPLACGIEYLHTSSLIFDDLPAQDNSDLRRGRATLHKTAINDDVPPCLYEGRAQLTAVDLIAISMNIINHGLIKQDFSPSKINQVIGEISLLMHGLCIGQMMDLRAARIKTNEKVDNLDTLDRIAWLKTGKTIEAVLVTPAILCDRIFEDQKAELSRLRELSRLMGILFQMRDDLLDVEASDTIGKPTALDVKNNTTTYVSVLGIDGTQARLGQYLAVTLKLIDSCWPNDAETVKDVVRHIVSRKT
jgi:geranylgeranyl pyrophosphate synthase